MRVGRMLERLSKAVASELKLAAREGKRKPRR